MVVIAVRYHPSPWAAELPGKRLEREAEPPSPSEEFKPEVRHFGNNSLFVALETVHELYE